jgi:hypothetical protein
MFGLSPDLVIIRTYVAQLGSYLGGPVLTDAMRFHHLFARRSRITSRRRSSGCAIIPGLRGDWS